MKTLLASIALVSLTIVPAMASSVNDPTQMADRAAFLELITGQRASEPTYFSAPTPEVTKKPTKPTKPTELPLIIQRIQADHWISS